MALNEDYSSKDFIDVYEELLEIVEASTTKWDPRHSTEADPGVVLLKLIALLEDKHQYRSDMARNQGFLDTVTDKQSAYELLEMLGYIMKQARCATGEITLQPTNISSKWEEGYELTVPRFTEITDSTGTYKFFTLNEVTFDGTTVVNTTSSAERSTVVQVQAGEPFQITKDGTSLFSLKDVDEDGRLYLGKTNLAQNGVFVYTAVEDEDTGDITETENSWTYIDFAILKPVSNWYTVATSTDDETYIQFPDDFESLIGTSTFTVWGTYTEGAASNISANVLSTFTDDSYGSYLAIKQLSAFSNGQNAETIAQARTNYYAAKDVCNTLVSASDYRSAIRYLVCNLTASNTGFIKGNQYFSNAIVRTAKDRRINTRSVAYGTGYDLFIPETAVPSDQIDVIGLRKSDTYSESFQRIDKAAELAQIKADLEDQLQDSRSIDVMINMEQDYPRLLAVTTPDITIRIQNYTSSLASTVREEVINYFQSTYIADNVTAGEGFDYQTIVDDIKGLDTSILSISMQDLTYTIYSKYEEVDEEDSVLASATTITVPITTELEVTDSDGNSYTIITSTTSEINLLLDTAARAVVAGDVPLFRYYNRQNTLTKQETAYSILSSITTDTELESTILVPIAAISYEQLGPIDSTTGVSEAYTPYIVSLSYLPSIAKGTYNREDTGVACTGFELTGNQLLQIRRPLHTETETYGYGYKYIIYGHRLGKEIDIYSASSIGVGSVLTAGTTIYSRNTLENATGVLQSDGEIYLYTLTSSLEITGSAALSVLEGSVLSADCKIAIGSTINGETYAPMACADGEEYQLQSGEILYMVKSSDSASYVNKTAGTWIQPSGFSLYFSTNSASDSTVLGSTSSISILTNDSCYISDEYLYFLSLRSNKASLTISKDEEYMLEEDELFVYANVGITEYVALGPGTVLRLDTTNSKSSIESITLVNTPYTTLEEVNADMFNELASGASIEAQSYELTTWGEGRGVLVTGSWTIPTDFGQIDSEGTDISVIGDKTLWIYDELTLEENKWIVSDDDLLGTYTGYNYEVRLVIQLESDEDGMLDIEYPVSITITSAVVTEETEDTVTIDDIIYSTRTIAPKSSSTDGGIGEHLATSTPVSGVYKAVSSSDNASLLYSPGVTGRLSAVETETSRVTYADATSISLTNLSVTVTISDSIEFTTGTDGLYHYDIASFAIPVVTLQDTILHILLRFTVDPQNFRFTGYVDDDGNTSSDDSITFSLSAGSVGIYGDTDILAAGTSVTLDMLQSGEFGATVFAVISSEDNISYATDSEGNQLGDGYVTFKIVWNRQSPISSDSSTYEGMSFSFSDLSYIYGFSSELQADSSEDDSIPASEDWTLTYYDKALTDGTTEKALLDRIKELDADRRYDYLTMPSEMYSHPTVSFSYLESAHPYNAVTFPYLALSASKIKVIKGR